MSTDNNALWELVEKWREDGMDMIHKPSVLVRIECREHADELAAILERPVVVDRTHLEALEMIRDWPDEIAEAMGYEIAFHALKAIAKAVTTDYTRTPVYSESMVRGKS